MKYSPPSSSIIAAVMALSGTLLSATFAQEPPGQDTTPGIEVRGRDWKVIAQGEEIVSTASGTDFGGHNIVDGHRNRVFYIVNTGDAELQLGDSETPDTPAVAVTGVGASQFAITRQPRDSVRSSGRRHRSTSFTVAFNPDAVGVHAARVSISHNASDGSRYEFAIQGEGTPSDDDHSDRYQFATPIDIGIEAAGIIQAAKDEDWFTFTLAEPTEITALSDADVNLKSGLYSSRGRFIVSNDDDGGGGNFLIKRVLDAGQYYQKVRASNRQDVGEYTFSLNGVPANIAPEITVSGDGIEVVSGAASASADDGTEFGKLLVGHSSTHRFVIVNEETATLELGDVSITEEVGFKIARKPSSSLRPGKSTSLRISFVPSAAGVASATVSIANNDADETPYTFTVSGTGTLPPPDDHGNSFEDATAIADSKVTAVDAEITGVIGDRNDKDYFTFTTEAESEVLIETTGDLNTKGYLYDADGKRIASDKNDGEGSNFRIRKAVPAGKYFVRVKAGDSDTGAYTLILTIGTPAPEMAVSGYIVVDHGKRRWKSHQRVDIVSGSPEASPGNGTDFGAVNVAEGSRRRQFKISNHGSTSLELSGDPIIAISGAGAEAFSISHNPASSIRPGRYTYFTVTFDPSAAGGAAAVVSIANNDSDENPFNFAIQGDGTVAAPVDNNDEVAP